MVEFEPRRRGLSRICEPVIVGTARCLPDSSDCRESGYVYEEQNDRVGTLVCSLSRRPLAVQRMQKMSIDAWFELDEGPTNLLLDFLHDNDTPAPGMEKISFSWRSGRLEVQPLAAVFIYDKSRAMLRILTGHASILEVPGDDTAVSEIQIFLKEFQNHGCCVFDEKLFTIIRQFIRSVLFSHDLSKLFLTCHGVISPWQQSRVRRDLYVTAVTTVVTGLAVLNGAFNWCRSTYNRSKSMAVSLVKQTNQKVRNTTQSTRSPKQHKRERMNITLQAPAMACAGRSVQILPTKQAGRKVDKCAKRDNCKGGHQRRTEVHPETESSNGKRSQKFIVVSGATGWRSLLEIERTSSSDREVGNFREKLVSLKAEQPFPLNNIAVCGHNSTRRVKPTGSKKACINGMEDFQETEKEEGINFKACQPEEDKERDHQSDDVNLSPKASDSNEPTNSDRPPQMSLSPVLSVSHCGVTKRPPLARPVMPDQAIEACISDIEEDDLFVNTPQKANPGQQLSCAYKSGVDEFEEDLYSSCGDFDIWDVTSEHENIQLVNNVSSVPILNAQLSNGTAAATSELTNGNVVITNVHPVSSEKFQDYSLTLKEAEQCTPDRNQQDNPSIVQPASFEGSHLGTLSDQGLSDQGSTFVSVQQPMESETSLVNKVPSNQSDTYSDKQPTNQFSHHSVEPSDESSTWSGVQSNSTDYASTSVNSDPSTLHYNVSLGDGTPLGAERSSNEQPTDSRSSPTLQQLKKQVQDIIKSRAGALSKDVRLIYGDPERKTVTINLRKRHSKLLEMAPELFGEELLESIRFTCGTIQPLADSPPRVLERGACLVVKEKQTQKVIGIGTIGLVTTCGGYLVAITCAHLLPPNQLSDDDYDSILSKKAKWGKVECAKAGIEICIRIEGEDTEICHSYHYVLGLYPFERDGKTEWDFVDVAVLTIDENIKDEHVIKHIYKNEITFDTETGCKAGMQVELLGKESFHTNAIIRSTNCVTFCLDSQGNQHGSDHMIIIEGKEAVEKGNSGTLVTSILNTTQPHQVVQLVGLLMFQITFKPEQEGPTVNTSHQPLPVPATLDGTLQQKTPTSPGQATPVHALDTKMPLTALALPSETEVVTAVEPKEMLINASTLDPNKPDLHKVDDAPKRTPFSDHKPSHTPDEVKDDKTVGQPVQGTEDVKLTLKLNVPEIQQDITVNRVTIHFDRDNLENAEKPSEEEKGKCCTTVRHTPKARSKIPVVEVEDKNILAVCDLKSALEAVRSCFGKDFPREFTLPQRDKSFEMALTSK